MPYKTRRHHFKKRRLTKRQYKRNQKGGVTPIPYFMNMCYPGREYPVLYSKQGVASSMDDLRGKIIDGFLNINPYQYDIIGDSSDYDDYRRNVLREGYVVIMEDNELFEHYAFINGNWQINPIGSLEEIFNLASEYVNDSNNNSNSNSNNNSNNSNSSNNNTNITHYRLPSNAVNAITQEPIENETSMVNFHNERSRGRYYTKATYKRFQSPKRNPFTRESIDPATLIRYKASVNR